VGSSGARIEFWSGPTVRTEEGLGDLSQFLQDGCWVDVWSVSRLRVTVHSPISLPSVVYEVESKLFRTGAAIYTAVVVARITGPTRPLEAPVPPGQTQRSTATFCGDCVNTCEDVVPNFGENSYGCFTMTAPRLTLPSSPSSFWRNKEWVSSPTHRTPLIWHPVTSSYFHK
jgi:hypothetical protein